jgi:hypothetical protein
MTERGSRETVEDVFADTCVLFDYAVERRSDARSLFDTGDEIEKVVSRRIEREFDSVATRKQDIHRELLEFAAADELDEYEPQGDVSQKNDVRYVVSLYSELTDLAHEVDDVRRLTELIPRLEKASDELFGAEGCITVLTVDGVDARLIGLLRGVIENEADVRVLCDAVAWRRDGGSGVFLTEDSEDILGKDGPDDEDEDDESNAQSESNGLPDSFADFLGTEDRSVPEQINDKIESRYGPDSRLRILSTAEFVERSARPVLDSTDD